MCALLGMKDGYHASSVHWTDLCESRQIFYYDFDTRCYLEQGNKNAEYGVAKPLLCLFLD